MSAATIGGRETKAALARIQARCRSLAASLGQTHTLTLRMPTADGKHLLWFDSGTTQGQPARPILTLDGRARDACIDAISTRLRQGLAAGDAALAWLPAIQVGAQAIRTVWVDRLDHNGADIAIAPLSPRYHARKVARGLDPRTGIATGAMRQSLASSLIVITRTK